MSLWYVSFCLIWMRDYIALYITVLCNFYLNVMNLLIGNALRNRPEFISHKMRLLGSIRVSCFLYRVSHVLLLAVWVFDRRKAVTFPCFREKSLKVCLKYCAFLPFCQFSPSVENMDLSNKICLVWHKISPSTPA